jgi:hypothetical protein
MKTLISVLALLIGLIAFSPSSHAECFQLSEKQGAWAADSDRLCIHESYGGWMGTISTGLPTVGGGAVGIGNNEVASFLLTRLKHPTCSDCNKDEFGVATETSELLLAGLTLRFEGTVNRPKRLESGLLWIGDKKLYYRSYRAPAMPKRVEGACYRLKMNGSEWQRVSRKKHCQPLVAAPADRCYKLSNDGKAWASTDDVTGSEKDTLCIDFLANRRMIARLRPGSQQGFGWNFSIKPKKGASCRGCNQVTLVLDRPSKAILKGFQIRRVNKGHSDAGLSSGRVMIGDVVLSYRSLE